LELEKFTAHRFRNLRDLEISPDAGMNVIYGENAQGKTNLLEAIYALSTLRSFRTKNLPETVQFGQNDSLLEGRVKVQNGHHLLTLFLDRSSRHAMLDRKKTEALEYLGALNVFLFSYPLLEVVRGGPEERRKFLDRSISMSRPGYLPVLVNYHRAVRQKTALLALVQRGEINRREGLNSLAAFNQQLLEHGLEVVRYRAAYLDQLQELLREKQQLFFEKELIPGLELSSSFLASREEAERKLSEACDREIARAICMVGVHRDEVRMILGGNELRKYGSSGQHRAFLLLVLLAQLDLYERWRGDRPVLLLDDLDSELDRYKIQSFLQEIQNRYQTWISTSRRELFETQPDHRLFEIRSGALLEM
jgi:DNA replication and repair protein RecF